MEEAPKRSAPISDMTRGEPVRLILAFAIPIFIGNIFQQIYNMVDTMVAGYFLGDSAIAAIGATSSLRPLVCGGTAFIIFLSATLLIRSFRCIA